MTAYSLGVLLSEQDPPDVTGATAAYHRPIDYGHPEAMHTPTAWSATFSAHANHPASIVSTGEPYLSVVGGAPVHRHTIAPKITKGNRTMPDFAGTSRRN